MALASRKAVLDSKNKLNLKKVPVPGWIPGDKKAFVYVRQFRGEDAEEVRELCQDSLKPDAQEAQLQARWCVLGICDAKGKRLFAPADVPELLQGPLLPMQRCAIEVMRINGIQATPSKKS